MKQNRFTAMTILGASLATAFVSIFASPLFAITLTLEDGANSAKGADQVANMFGVSGVFSTITNIMLFLVGAISVIMIIIGGLRYVISGGNSSNITAAKNTILYAVIGLVVAILAYAIINFVITSFAPGTSGVSGGTNV